MKKLMLLVLVLLNVTMYGKVVFDPDKIDKKLVEQIEADLDARKLTTKTTKKLRGIGPDTFEVVRILKTPGEKNSYHGVVEPVVPAGKGNYIRSNKGYGRGYVFKAKTDDQDNLKELEINQYFDEYEKSVHKYFEKLARKYLGEYVRARGGGRIEYSFNPSAFYMTFDEMVADTNAGIGLGEEIKGGAKIYIFNEMNSQEEIDKLRENLFNLVKELQEIKMNYEVLYIYVIKPIALLTQEEIAEFTEGAALSNCVEESEKQENTCDYVVGVMKIINRKMDGVVDGREKKESTVEFVRKAVNRLSYDGLTKFDSTSYKDLNTQFGFNRVHKIKKIEDIVFGENREGKYYGVNYYKKGIDEEERRKRLSERAMEEEIERTQEKFRKR